MMSKLDDEAKFNFGLIEVLLSMLLALNGYNLWWTNLIENRVTAVETGDAYIKQNFIARSEVTAMREACRVQRVHLETIMASHISRTESKIEKMYEHIILQQNGDGHQ